LLEVGIEPVWEVFIDNLNRLADFAATWRRAAAPGLMWKAMPMRSSKAAANNAALPFREWPTAAIRPASIVGVLR
jgi:hypothetical protein